MRINLDDNERGAFNYLIGGLFVVLVLRLVAWLADVFGPQPTPDGLVLQPFQHGYLGMRDELVVTGASMDLSERVVLAVVLAVGASFLVALLFTLVARARGRHAGRPGRWASRSALLITLAWSLYAAFCLPVKTSRITDGHLVVSERRALLGDIPLPFTLKEQHYTRQDIEQVRAEEHPPIKGCDGSVVLELVIAVQAQVEQIAAVGDVCPEERMDHLHTGSEASALLERELR